MAKPIVARWEWRTFGAGFEESEARIRMFEQGNFKESGEVYVLSRNSDENVKVRDDLLDIKSLQEVNEATAWSSGSPSMKAGFPDRTWRIWSGCSCFSRFRSRFLDGRSIRSSSS